MSTTMRPQKENLRIMGEYRKKYIIYFNKNGVPAELVYRIINNCYINVNFSFALHKPGCVPLKSCKNVTVQPAPFAKTPDGVFPLLRS